MAFDKFHDKNTNVQPFFLKFATMRYQKPYVGSGSSIISMAPSRHPVIHSVRCMGNASGFSKALWNKAAVSTMIYYLVQCAWRNKSHFSLSWCSTITDFPIIFMKYLLILPYIFMFRPRVLWSTQVEPILIIFWLIIDDLCNTLPSDDFWSPLLDAPVNLTCTMLFWLKQHPCFWWQTML